MKKNTILVVGYSVTLQTNGYYDLLIKNPVHGFLRYAIGGVNLHSMLYLLNELPLNDVDICILEISTSPRWLGGDVDRYVNILTYIVDYIQKRGVNVGILDLPRLDTRRDTDPLVFAIEQIGADKSIPTVSVTEFPGGLSNYLYDGTHTNHAGAVLYANAASELIARIANIDPQRSSPRGLPAIDFQPRILNIRDIISSDFNQDLTIFSRGGVTRDVLTLNEGVVANVELENDVYVMGILLRIGPETGMLHCISNPSGKSFEKLYYDERSYYQRFFPWFFRAGYSKSLQFMCSHVEVRPKLLKGDQIFGVQSASLAGVFVANSPPPF